MVNMVLVYGKGRKGSKAMNEPRMMDDGVVAGERATRLGRILISL